MTDNLTKEILAEEWRQVVGYDFYMVSNLGRVKSLTRTPVFKDGRNREFEGQILKPIKARNDYLQANLFVNGKNKLSRIHRLVAQAFIPNPDSKPMVNHKDGDKSNNNVSNLEWCTRQENEEHASKNGLKAFGERQALSKLTEKQVLEIRAKHISTLMSYNILAKEYGVAQTTVHNIVNRKTWKHI